MHGRGGGIKMRTIETVAAENNIFRMTLISSSRNRVVFSDMVAALDDETRERLITEVRGFNLWTEENDPHGEKDFGRVTLDGVDYFWKIDYLDDNFEYGVDPLEVKPNRVLTIMRACEY
jgi:hypothetical protein